MTQIPSDQLIPLPPAASAKRKKAVRKLVPVPSDAPEQLAFYQSLFGTPSGTGYTFDLWDAIPKFVLSKTRYHKQATVFETSFVWDDKTIPVEIMPALIRRSAASTVLEAVLPGPREELVWRILIEMAAEQSMPQLYEAKVDKLRYGRVDFTLNGLRDRLASRGKGYRLDELREALVVLKRAECHVKHLNIPDSYDNYLTSLYFAGESIADGEALTHCVAFLNPIVTNSILNLECCPIDSEKVCNLNHSLARWLITKISNRYRQAEQDDAQKGKGYPLLLTTIIQEACLVATERTKLRDQAVRVREALNELAESGYLCGFPRAYDEEPRYARAHRVGRTSLIDVKWTIYLSSRFAETIVAGNAEMAARRERRRQIPAVSPTRRLGCAG